MPSSRDAPAFTRLHLREGAIDCFSWLGRRRPERRAYPLVACLRAYTRDPIRSRAQQAFACAAAVAWMQQPDGEPVQRGVPLAHVYIRRPSLARSVSAHRLACKITLTYDSRVDAPRGRTRYPARLSGPSIPRYAFRKGPCRPQCPVRVPHFWATEMTGILQTSGNSFDFALLKLFLVEQVVWSCRSINRAIFLLERINWVDPRKFLLTKIYIKVYMRLLLSLSLSLVGSADPKPIRRMLAGRRRNQSGFPSVYETLVAVYLPRDVAPKNSFRSHCAINDSQRRRNYSVLWDRARERKGFWNAKHPRAAAHSPSHLNRRTRVGLLNLSRKKFASYYILMFLFY